MSVQESSANSHAQAPAEGDIDLTGRDRLVSNVFFSWCAYSVFFIGGLFLPRMIDRKLGQEMLGVWDFAWSLVNYFQLVRAGIGSSVNRYVARYWAAGDIAGVNRVVSSSFCVLGLAGLLTLGLTVAASLCLPRWFGGRLGGNVREAQWVVFFLGATLAVQACFSTLNGVLTGCHQWGLHNINTSGWYVAVVASMIVALLVGGSLRSLAVINLVGEILATIRRAVLARRVCTGLQVRPSLVSWSMIKSQFAFGGKTVIPSVSSLLLNQTTSILILAYLGPAALALFTRPRSVMYHVNGLVNKMAMTLTPTTSSLESTGDVREIQDLTIAAARYSLYLALPVVLALVVFGGPIIQFWMGPRYGGSVLPAILAAGHLAVLVQLPALSILAGLNAHGRAGLGRLVASLCSVGLTIAVLKYLGWGLVGTAVAVTLPLTILNVVDIPLLICRRVGLGARRYYATVLIRPVVHTLPFGICLIAARLIWRDRPMTGLAFGAAIGGAILAVTYWRHVLPDSMRAKISKALRSGGRTVCTMW